MSRRAITLEFGRTYQLVDESVVAIKFMDATHGYGATEEDKWTRRGGQHVSDPSRDIVKRADPATPNRRAAQEQAEVDFVAGDAFLRRRGIHSGRR